MIKLLDFGGARIAGSAHATCIRRYAGVNAVRPAACGGANEAVLRQLKAIRDSAKSVREFVAMPRPRVRRFPAGLPRIQVVAIRAAIAGKYLEKIMEREDAEAAFR